MDEFSAIADDLSTWEHHISSYAYRRSRTSTAATACPATGRLNSDLQHLAVLVCVMASAANALENGSDNRALPAMITDFCPSQAFDAASKLENVVDSADGDQIADALHELQARLSFAQMLTKHLAGKFRDDKIAKSSDIEILADAWRRTSTSLLTVLTDLSVRDKEPDNRTLILGFLRNCIDGGMPCLTADGHLEIPGWAERRSAARVSIQKPAQASTGGDYFDVEILNVSTIGLGLTGEAKSGQHTTVILEDGRKVSGTVKWSEDGRFGLKLDEPLSKTDGLLAKRQ